MKRGHCRHFNGVMSNACKAGISYEQITQGHDLEIPCIPGSLLFGRTRAKCDKFSAPTKEEVELYEADAKDRAEFMLKAVELCRSHSEVVLKFEVGRHDVGGEVPCPKCNRTMRYVRSSYNGHLRGECQTAGCLKWIE